MVRPKLDEKEEEEARGGASGGDVEEVLYAPVPRGGGIVGVGRGRGGRHR